MAKKRGDTKDSDHLGNIVSDIYTIRGLAHDLEYGNQDSQVERDILRGMGAIATRAGRALDQYVQSIGGNVFFDWEDYRKDGS
ncbi:MAG TPA: hypothetical protein VJT81_00415 [Burkholderiales bacterium]|nr:hypothetical protein [Burkholderiales bacterium]